MTSLHAILYMYSTNRSSDNLVPVNNATTQHCADLFINLCIRLPNRIDSYSSSFVSLSYSRDTTWRSQQDGQSKSNREHRLFTQRNLRKNKLKDRKDTPKITLPTFEKRGIQEAKLWWRRFTQYIKMTQNIDPRRNLHDYGMYFFLACRIR